MKNLITALVTAAVTMAAIAAINMALAAEVTVTVPSIDFGPLLTDIILPFAGTLVVGLAGFALRAFMKKVGMEADNEIRAYLDTALNSAATYGLNRAAEAIKGDWTKVQIQNAAVAEGANYALARVPDALGYFKVDPKTLANMIVARLDPVAVAAVTPAAPPVG
jgi:hypothetical protein